MFSLECQLNERLDSVTTKRLKLVWIETYINVYLMLFKRYFSVYHKRLREAHV